MAEMQYRNLGRSGLKVSALTLGTLWFGSKVDEKTAVDIVDKALAAGINCVDTADIYGFDGTSGFGDAVIRHMDD